MHVSPARVRHVSGSANDAYDSPLLSCVLQPVCGSRALCDATQYLLFHIEHCEASKTRSSSNSFTGLETATSRRGHNQCKIKRQMEPTGPSDPLNEMLRQFDRISEKSHNMANVRDICALMEYPIPYQYPSVSRKLRCVYTGRDIKCNIKFDGLTLERLIIYENQLWAIDDRKHIVAFNVTSGEKVHEIMFPRGIGVGLTIFKDRMFAYSTYELYEIKHIPGTTTRALVLEAIFPHEIFALLIQRRDEQQISFVVETQRGKIIEAVVANQNVARCRLLKSDNHFLSGVYGSHVFVYCLDSNDIIDTRNNIIERSFPPEHDEMLCRFRMSQDGILYYCCWDEIDEPWTIVSLNAVTGNRRFYPTDSNHIYMIPCARFVPVYEDE